MSRLSGSGSGSGSGAGGGGGSKGILARVQLDSSLRSSLVHLPISLHAPLVERNVAPQNIVVELVAVDAGRITGEPSSSSSANGAAFEPKYYCGWTGQASAPSTGAQAFGNSSNGGGVSGFTSNSLSNLVPHTSVVSLSPALASSFSAGSSDASSIPRFVRITLLRSPPLPTAARVDVTPVEPDDWEILSTHAEEVELNLLSQCRAACEGQILVVFVGKGGRVTCRLRVDSTEPPTNSILPRDPYTSAASSSSTANAARAVRLSTDTELVIAPKSRAAQKSQEVLPQEVDISPASAAGASVSASKRLAGRAGELSPAEAMQQLSKTLYRVLPLHLGPRQLPSPPPTSSSTSASPRRRPPIAHWTEQCALLDSRTQALMSRAFPNGRCSVTKIPCPSGSTGGGMSAKSDERRSGRRADRRPKSLMGGNGEAGEERQDEEDQSGEEDDLASSSESIDASSSENASDERKSSDSSESKLPERPTTGAAFMSGEGYMLLDTLDADQGTGQAPQQWWPQRHVWLGARLREALGLKDYDLVLFGSPSPAISSQIAKLDVPPVEAYIADASLRTQSAPTGGEKKRLAGVDKILDTAVSAATDIFLARSLFPTPRGFRGNASSPCGILLTGSSGAGKTAVAREIVRRLCKPLHPSPTTTLFASHLIDCTSFSEERVPALRSSFTSWLNAAAWNSPSVLVLDNVDRIIPAEQEHADSTRTRQLTENLISRVKEACMHYDIFVIMTAQSTSSMHALLNSSHLFAETIQLKPPSKEARRDILQLLVDRKLSHGNMPQRDLNFVTLSTMMEGYLPADLWDLIERAVHQAVIRTASAKGLEVALTTQDFAKAQEGFTPLSLRDIKLQKSDIAWSDIGGLHETRRILRETLEWPTKYAAIFASCPLRLRSGLLLYGYPGCGKTLLASAVAKECGLNFISVKGPEILNKYIGASEKSVRDLFDRAQAAKPCVLFFDEFDSIAPKRGHDSTGVTDRVVNQLLTQMDGAEGLDGVYVLAATSRPDLIDSALLRPGRLDKSLLCDMPDEVSRLDIMRAVSQKINLDESVDLSEWARKTDGFSGADLQAFMYNAHLETIHETISMTRDAQASGEQKKESEESEEREIKFVQLGDDDKVNKLSGAQEQALQRRLALMLENSASRPRKQQQQQRAMSNGHAHAVTATGEENGHKPGPVKRLITSAHLEKSLQATRPSVPVEEQRRLRRIYAEFAGERDGKFPSGEASQKIGARESLM